jgi:hypothetical protein
MTNTVHILYIFCVQDSCGFEERLEDGLEDSFDGYESIDSASVALEWRVLSREQDTS